MTSDNLSIQCPGKINLYLDITGKRENGYHDIETLFLPIHQPCDKLTLTRTEKNITIHCDHPAVPTDKKNLCWKAAQLFFDASGIEAGCSIELEKNLPVAGGMGGGSSNAAAVLKLLNQLYDKPLDENRLKELALKIGADVPYFLSPVPAYAKGIGEKLYPVKKIPSLHILLITFNFPISAAWAYQNRLLAPGSGPFKLQDLIQSLQKESLHEVATLIYNDLAGAIRKKFPILEKAINDSILCGALAAEVSGSGPTVFVLESNKESATRTRQALIDMDYNPENLFLCSTASR